MMHFTPDQVRNMSLVEVRAAIDGFQEFNGARRHIDEPPTLDEIDEAKAAMPDVPPAPGVPLLPEFQPGWDGKL